MVLEILRQVLAGLQPRAQFGVRRVARDDHRAGDGDAGADWMLAQARANIVHGLVEVDRHHGVRQLVGRGLRHEARGVGFQLLQIHALGGDLGERLAVGGA